MMISLFQELKMNNPKHSNITLLIFSQKPRLSNESIERFYI